MKNWKKVARLVLLSSGGLAAFPVSCNSIFAKSKTDDGYETVSATGSMLPQRVKKGEAAASDSATSSMSANDFDRMRQRVTMPPPKGN